MRIFFVMYINASGFHWTGGVGYVTADQAELSAKDYIASQDKKHDPTVSYRIRYVFMPSTNVPKALEAFAAFEA